MVLQGTPGWKANFLMLKFSSAACPWAFPLVLYPNNPKHLPHASPQMFPPYLLSSSQVFFLPILPKSKSYFFLICPVKQLGSGFIT